MLSHTKPYGPTKTAIAAAKEAKEAKTETSPTDDGDDFLPHPSHPDYPVAIGALLSAHVYSLDQPSPHPLPKGWSLYQTRYHRNGYAGACYLKDASSSEGPSYVVFAHRGTVITNLGDLASDVAIEYDHIPHQLQTAIAFYRETAANLAMTYHWSPQLKHKYQHRFWLHTGHSLGAILAELCGIAINLTFAADPSCPWLLLDTIFTYESPGAKSLLTQWIKAHPNLITATRLTPTEILQWARYYTQHYFSNINVINSCHNQVGPCYKIEAHDYDYSPYHLQQASAISPHYYRNFNYLFHYSLEQHSIQRLCKNIQTAIIHKIAFHRVDYPAGLQQGYQTYLDYTDDSQKIYWDGYIDTLWALKPKDDYASFRSRFLHDLNEVQQKAKALTPIIPPSPKLLPTSNALVSPEQSLSLVKTLGFFAPPPQEPPVAEAKPDPEVPPLETEAYVIVNSDEVADHEPPPPSAPSTTRCVIA